MAPKLAVLATAFSLFTSQVVQAATLEATLTGDSLSQYLSPFTIEFTDSDNDNLLDFGEITSFSGFTSFPLGSSNPSVLVSFDTILGIASVAGATDGGVNFWLFGKSSGTDTFGPNVARYNYSLTLASVPVPAGFPLFVVGLGALALLRRCKNKAV